VIRQINVSHAATLWHVLELADDVLKAECLADGLRATSF
jgi:hypothetical protein